MESKRKRNRLVTITHIVLIVTFTILSIMLFSSNKFRPNSREPEPYIPYYRAFACYSFVGGFSEIFMIFLIWKVINNSKSTYAVEIKG